MNAAAPPHPSRVFIGEVLETLEPESRRAARLRDRQLLAWFQSLLHADLFQLRTSLQAIMAESSIIPPEPPTPRARLGRWFIRLQSRTLWWLVRSIRLRDHTIHSLCIAVESLIINQRVLEARLDALAAQAAPPARNGSPSADEH